MNHLLGHYTNSFGDDPYILSGQFDEKGINNLLISVSEILRLTDQIWLLSSGK
jgi:hypothetical protein